MNGHFQVSSFVCTSCSRALRSSQSLRYRLPAPGAKYTSAARYDSPQSLRHRSVSTYNNAAFIGTSHGVNSRRHYATTSTSIPPSPDSSAAANDAHLFDLIPKKGLVRLSHRRLISLSGRDTAKFLQGLVTNNVDPKRSEPFYSAFLDARGRVLWDIFIWPQSSEQQEGSEWSCFIDVDATEVDSILRHLKKHKLRSKITIRILEDSEYTLWTSWGTLPTSTPASFLEDPRAQNFGSRLLYKDQPSTSSSSSSFFPSNLYHIRRHLFGIPEGPAEIPRENALPMEYNIDLSHGIDFKKGCYVGQELTIRTKHTGVVRKRILPIQFYTPQESTAISLNLPQYNPSFTQQIPNNTDIKQLDENGGIKKGRAAGKIVGSVGNIGLALCRLEMMTPVRISAEGGTYKAGMEFGVLVPETNAVVRVKAFVPEWLKQREEELWAKGRGRGLHASE